MKSRPGAAAALLLALLLLTRWPFHPAIFLTFDNVNFALGLERFNPAEHRPQPPGYPLFIDLAHLIGSVVSDVHLIFLLAGIVGAFVASWMTWKLGTSMAGPAAGLAAGLLVIVHPAVWSANLLNPVRVWLAAGSATIAWLAWECRGNDQKRRWMWPAAWFVLGIAGGFRPELTVLLLPLLIFAGWRRGTTLSEWIGAIVSLALGVLPWLAQVVLAVGGADAYFRLLRGYLREQSQNTSVLYGGTVIEAARMAGRAIIWLFAGAAGWIWFAGSRRIPNVPFFLLWALPPFVFVTLVHSAEPGHVLVLVPVIAVAGGAVLAQFKLPQKAFAILVPAALFLFPLPGPTGASSLKAVRQVESRTAALLGSIRAENPAFVRVTTDAPVAWRIISFYFPEIAVLVPQDTVVWTIRNNVLVPEGPKSGKLLLVDSGGLHREVLRMETYREESVSTGVRHRQR